MAERMTPIGALARGLAAGVAGTAAMTVWQERAARMRRSGDSDSDSDSGGGGEASDDDAWEQASAPAQVARRLAAGLFRKDLPVSSIPVVTNVMHWAYGTGWGAAYGLLAGSRSQVSALRFGALFGAGVWAMSYVQLVPMGLYEPPWKYPPQELALDLSYHLVYGVGLGVAFSGAQRV